MTFNNPEPEQIRQLPHNIRGIAVVMGRRIWREAVKPGARPA